MLNDQRKLMSFKHCFTVNHNAGDALSNQTVFHSKIYILKVHPIHKWWVSEYYAGYPGGHHLSANRLQDNVERRHPMYPIPYDVSYIQTLPAARASPLSNDAPLTLSLQLTELLGAAPTSTQYTGIGLSNTALWAAFWGRDRRRNSFFEESSSLAEASLS